MALGKKTGGRKKGSLNRVNTDAKSVIAQILRAESAHFQQALRDVEPDVYLNIIVKLMQMITPKQVQQMIPTEEPKGEITNYNGFK